jgi:hypothetical protein
LTTIRDLEKAFDAVAEWVPDAEITLIAVLGQIVRSAPLP